MPQDEILRAIANNTRRKIVETLLIEGELGYADLMKRLNLGLGSSGKLAYHIKRLEKAGLISKTIDGKYRLSSMGREVAETLLSEEFENKDPLAFFRENVDLDLYATGGIIFLSSLLVSFFQFGYILAWLFRIPVKVELSGNVFVKEINIASALLLLLSSLALLVFSLDLLKKSSEKFSLLEKLVYQKLLFVMLARSGRLSRYVVLFVVSLMLCVMAALLPVLL